METCDFESNSVSPEKLYIEDTMIDATKFIRAIATNTEHLPPEVTKAFQEHMLAETKANMAMSLYSSTRSGASLTYYNLAQKELILANLEKRIESRHYKELKGTGKPVPRCGPSFYFLTSLLRLERFIVRSAGLLTQWGESICVPCIFLIGGCLLFSAIYYYHGWIPIMTGAGGSAAFLRAFIKALNIGLVAGFTAYFKPEVEGWGRQAVELANLLFGIFWYSLIVPVITRKVLR
jgi:hypothetical protein